VSAYHKEIGTGKGKTMKVIQIILAVLSMMTPQLRAEFTKFFDEWSAKAKQTPSPADDAIVMILRGLLGV
jgi:hypothetical protein